MVLNHALHPLIIHVMAHLVHLANYLRVRLYGNSFECMEIIYDEIFLLVDNSMRRKISIFFLRVAIHVFMAPMACHTHILNPNFLGPHTQSGFL